MDLQDIRQLPTVAERLKAMGPGQRRGPHCWFCGKVEAWFQCDCKEAVDAQQGRRPKPRFDAKMILDEEIIERNLKWGVGRRYMAPAKPILLPGPPQPREQKKAPSVNKPVHEAVHTAAPVNADADVTVHAPAETVHAGDSAVHADSGAARRAYRADWQRKKRAEEKATAVPRDRQARTAHSTEE